MPTELAEAIRDKADQLDVSVSEYIAGVLAEGVGLPRPLYERERIAQRKQEEQERRRKQREELPIGA